MGINRIITKHELWNLPNEQIAELIKGKFVRVVQNNGLCNDVYVRNLLAAVNPPHSFIGFLTVENHSIFLQNIEHVELL